MFTWDWRGLGTVAARGPGEGRVVSCYGTGEGRACVLIGIDEGVQSVLICKLEKREFALSWNCGMKECMPP